MNFLERGPFSSVVLLDSVTLTGDFADNESEVVRVSPFTQVEFSLVYTENGAETNNSAVIKLLFSNDGDSYEEYSARQDGSPSGGVVKSTLHRLRFLVPGNPGVSEDRWFTFRTAAKFLKIQAMEEGIAANGGTLTVKLRFSDDESE